jgi:hypothetical protein
MLNGLVLGYLMCIARSDFGVYKYIWMHYHDTPVFLTYVQQGASVPDNAVLMSMPLRFYTPESVYIHKSKQFTQWSCQHPSTCLTWVSCSENVPKNHKNIKLVYDSCKIYDKFKPYVNVSHWMDRSVLFRRAKLYELS